MKNNLLNRSRRVMALFVTGAGLMQLSGCPVTGREFVATAGPSVKNGVTLIVNGLLDGLFAAIEPDATTAN